MNHITLDKFCSDNQHKLWKILGYTGDSCGVRNEELYIKLGERTVVYKVIGLDKDTLENIKNLREFLSVIKGYDLIFYDFNGIKSILKIGKPNISSRRLVIDSGYFFLRKSGTKKYYVFYLYEPMRSNVTLNESEIFTKCKQQLLWVISMDDMVEVEDIQLEDGVLTIYTRYFIYHKKIFMIDT